MTLRLTAEIVPFGEEGAKREIGTVEIYNTGTVTADAHGVVCNYEANYNGRRLCLGLHRREDGWMPLAARALRAFTEEKTDGNEGTHD